MRLLACVVWSAVPVTMWSVSCAPTTADDPGISSPVAHVDRQAPVNADVPLGADPPQETKRLAIAPEQHVLSVVDPLACHGIRECRRATAKRRPRLEHEHAQAALGQQRRGAEPGKSGADHNRVRPQIISVPRCLGVPWQ